MCIRDRVLTGLAVFLKATGRKGWMLYGPMTVMFVVTMTALIQACLRIFRSMADGSFVFMVGGLQLIIAVALIILALLVVYHCVMKLREQMCIRDSFLKCSMVCQIESSISAVSWLHAVPQLRQRRFQPRRPVRPL